MNVSEENADPTITKAMCMGLVFVLKGIVLIEVCFICAELVLCGQRWN